MRERAWGRRGGLQVKDACKEFSLRREAAQDRAARARAMSRKQAPKDYLASGVGVTSVPAQVGDRQKQIDKTTRTQGSKAGGPYVSWKMEKETEERCARAGATKPEKSPGGF